jgi:hypothetical protein
MKTTVSLVLAGAVLVAMASSAAAQVGDTNPWSTWKTVAETPAGKTLDSDALGGMLGQLGYTAQRIDVPGGHVAFQITDTRGGVSNVHYVGIDATFKTIVVCSSINDSTLSYNPDQASAQWLLKVVKFNNLNAPSYIFLNPNNAIGMMTTFGNHEMTLEHVKSMLSTHMSNYEVSFLPLLRELASPAAPAAPSAVAPSAYDPYGVLGG